MTEPVTTEPIRHIRAPVFIQDWAPTVFLNWPVDATDAQRLLPAGCIPDTFDGITYVGLIPLVIRRIRVARNPSIPYLSTFVELNVRLYSVDSDGRRGIVFRSLDAERLIPVLAAQASYHLPYKWASMSYEKRSDDHHGDEHVWTSVRRWPGPVGAGARVKIRVGQPVPEPNPFEVFLTARWNLHTTLPAGQTAYAAAEHETWPLYTATVLDLDQDVIQAAGLPKPVGEPHALFSPGVTARIGPPTRIGRRATARSTLALRAVERPQS